jgi:hypothetical protein
VISQLDHRYAAEVEDVITSPPQQDPYTKLKTELLKRLSRCASFPTDPRMTWWNRSIVLRTSDRSFKQKQFRTKFIRLRQ